MASMQAMETNLRHQYEIVGIYIELGKYFIRESEKRLFGKRKLLRLAEQVLEKIHREQFRYDIMKKMLEELENENL